MSRRADLPSAEDVQIAIKHLSKAAGNPRPSWPSPVISAWPTRRSGATFPTSQPDSTSADNNPPRTTPPA